MLPHNESQRSQFCSQVWEIVRQCYHAISSCCNVVVGKKQQLDLQLVADHRFRGASVSVEAGVLLERAPDSQDEVGMELITPQDFAPH